MKIVVQYDKPDILRLIMEAIKASGIRIKEGTTIEYKGPLTAKFDVEVDDSPLVLANVATPAPTRQSAAPAVEEASTDGDDGDMTEVLQANGGLLKTTKAPFQRTLREGESEEWPGK